MKKVAEEEVSGRRHGLRKQVPEAKKKVGVVVRVVLEV